MSTNRGRISSVGRALDCRTEGRGFDSRDRTNTQGLTVTENIVPNKYFRAKYLDTQMKCICLTILTSSNYVLSLLG